MLDILTDIGMTLDGDLAIDSGGDLSLVSGIEFLRREINKIVKTNNPEWTLHPNVGADVNRYIGRSNTREVGREIEQSVREAIKRQFPDSGIEIRVVPKSRDALGVYMSIYSPALGRQEPIYTFNFYFSSGSVDADQDPLLNKVTVTDNRHNKTTNIYLNRRTRG